jgi:hypothetical protein
LISEPSRRAYLAAMQVDCWLPRMALPFAAPSPAAWLDAPESLAAPEPLSAPAPRPAVATSQPATQAAAPSPTAIALVQPSALAPPAKPPLPRPEVSLPSTAQSLVKANAGAAAKTAAAAATAPLKAKATAPPRFALQLLRAGPCVLLVELPTGEAFTRRDPAYLLLRDLLRAAGLPDSPQLLGEPVRWPLLRRGSLEQGPQAALEYVQGFLAARLEQEGDCRCLWLVGLPAVRFSGAGAGTAELYHRELQIEGLGAAWVLPGLELLIDEPARKAELWQAMRRVMHRWEVADE